MSAARSSRRRTRSRSDRLSRKPSGRRSRAATREKPSGRAARRIAAGNEDEFYEPRAKKNQTPYIIGGIAAGIIVIIILLIIVASPPDNGETNPGDDVNVVDEKAIYASAKVHRDNGEKLFHKFTRNNSKADGQRALAEAKKALKLLNDLKDLPTHKSDPGLEQEIVELQQLIIDIIRWLGI
ncbi:MAG: hypothetical protein ACYS8W_08155 [Planctomycetota bacterium]|jgi:hypothetical protein